MQPTQEGGRRSAPRSTAGFPPEPHRLPAPPLLPRGPGRPLPAGGSDPRRSACQGAQADDHSAFGRSASPATPRATLHPRSPNRQRKTHASPWFRSWFPVERTWADLRAPQPGCHAAAGMEVRWLGRLITRRSRVRIPPRYSKARLSPSGLSAFWGGSAAPVPAGEPRVRGEQGRLQCLGAGAVA